MRARSHTVVHSTISGEKHKIYGKPLCAQAQKEWERASELQTTVMIWRLALLEHQSKLLEPVLDSVKTAANKSHAHWAMVERSLDGQFSYYELRARMWWEKVAVQEVTVDVRPVHIGGLDNPSEGDEDLIAAHQ